MKLKSALMVLTFLLFSWSAKADDVGRWTPKVKNQPKEATLLQLIEMAEKWTQKKMSPSVLTWPTVSEVVREWTDEGGLRIAIPFKAKNKNGYVPHVVHCYLWPQYNDVTCHVTNEDKAL